MEFIIDRSKWRCGDDGTDALGKGNTKLLNDEGFMCCLGQVALQIGCEKSDINRLSCPDLISKLQETNNILTNHSKLPEHVNSELSLKAMRINDNYHITQKEREKQLIALFKKEGHCIKFINKGVKYKS